MIAVLCPPTSLPHSPPSPPPPPPTTGEEEEEEEEESEEEEGGSALKSSRVRFSSSRLRSGFSLGAPLWRLTSRIFALARLLQ